eukprot:735119-Prymnesium_polylepis.1
MHPGRPPLHNLALADHLELGTTEFTPEIWRDFGIDNLRSWDHIKTKQGKHFKPCTPAGKMATPTCTAQAPTKSCSPSKKTSWRS